MAWVPRRAIYLGKTAPRFDSMDASQCFIRGNISYCPPILMTIGAGHSGTTSMAYMLLQALRSLRLSTRGKETKVDWERAVPEGYVSLFPGTEPAGPFGIDLTPAAGGECAVSGARAAQRLQTLFPQTKLLVFLRNPADLLYSCSYCLDAERFDQVVQRSWHNLHAALCPIMLIRAWLAVFSLDRFLFISAERFAAHPSEHVRDVLSFLGWHHLASSMRMLPEVDVSARNCSHRVRGRLPMLDETRSRLQNVTCSCARELRALLHLNVTALDDDFVVNPAVDPAWCALTASGVQSSHMRPASSHLSCPLWPKCRNSTSARLLSRAGCAI